MVTIKEGFNGKPLIIRISGGVVEKLGEFWVEQEGLPEELGRYRSTLSYVSAAELIELKKHIEDILRAMIGL